MGARDKPNAVVIRGCLIVSALLGLAMESWPAFLVNLVVTIGGSYNAEGIRAKPDVRRHRGGRR